MSDTTTPTKTHMKAAIQLPTEPSYWGSIATEADVERILDNLEVMIRREFDDVEITFERKSEPQGTGIFADTDELHDRLFDWIEKNWTAAL